MNQTMKWGVGNHPRLIQSAEKGPVLELRGFSYAEQSQIIPVLLCTLDLCDCWLEQWRMPSPSQAVLCFEVHVRSVFELYSELAVTGVELTRESHVKLTGLCTMVGLKPRRAMRGWVRNVRLKVSFLDHNLDFGTMSIGMA